MARLKTAILISGRGSNMQALVDAAADPDYPAEIVRVISNVPGAGGLERAAQAGIATTAIDHRDFDGRASFEDALHAELTAAGVELICLAGFMRLLTADFVERWLDRMINIHPSLLPSFKGLQTHERVLSEGVRFTGCTVHFVRPAMDAGPIIVQAAVPVLPGDDADALAARVLTAEHRCYPHALQLVANGQTSIVDETVIVEGAAGPAGIAVNPDDKGS
ncbi:MAG: phosphoribosylglycinamide formyltransferase-1 [Paracoccaceae bacterium]|jgi:phosphoribosylglycinamide formyltransferase-1